MASTDKLLKNRELLLLVADAAGGTFSGKTVAQKLLYFAGVALDRPRPGTRRTTTGLQRRVRRRFESGRTCRRALGDHRTNP